MEARVFNSCIQINYFSWCVLVRYFPGDGSIRLSIKRKIFSSALCFSLSPAIFTPRSHHRFLHRSLMPFNASRTCSPCFLIHRLSFLRVRISGERGFFSFAGSNLRILQAFTISTLLVFHTFYTNENLIVELLTKFVVINCTIRAIVSWFNRSVEIWIR